MPKIPVRAARPTTQARALALAELTYQTLADWKPDQRKAYGLEVVFRKSVQVLRSAEADARRRVA